MSTDETTLSSQIFSSRETIRTQLIEEAEQYLELENIQTGKATFLSYVINVLSILTGNLMFYTSSVYRDFFLTRAQLPESIYDLSAYIGYTPNSADYSSATGLMSFPLSFGSTAEFTIPVGQSFYAGDVEFQTYYSTNVEITNNTDITITITDSTAGRIYEQNSTISDGTMYFLLDLRQYNSDVQEFQIPDDLGQYTFHTTDVNYSSGQASSLVVEVQDAGSSSWVSYTAYNSLYLIPAGTNGFVSRNITNGRRIYFGNRFIGSQPSPGATVRVTTLLTEGESGNVIENTIVRGNRLYTTAGQIVNYSVTNTSPARNGSDEETLQSIKSNAIANVVAQERIVSELDHQNIVSLAPSVPLISPLPILKRSDLKSNDVNLYTVLTDGTSIIPTRTDTLTTALDTTSIPQYNEVVVDGTSYYTMFGLELNRVNNSATYDYSVRNVTVSLSRSTLYDADYDMVSNSMTIIRDSTGSGLTITIPYTTDESTFGSASCRVLLDGTTYTTLNDSTAQEFVLEISDYQNISKGLQRIYVTFYTPLSESIVMYVGEVYIRRDLDLFMLSMISDGTSETTIYDVPLLDKTYYDALTSTQLNDFETNILQQLLVSFNVGNLFMLSEFINLKFSNTTGPMKSMLYDSTTIPDVINIVTSLPGSPSNGDRYILVDDSQYNGYIAQYSGGSWTYTRPDSDEIAYVTNNESKYIYTEFGWIVPQFNNPIQLEIEVKREDSYVGEDDTLKQTIRTALINDSSSTFGTGAELYRSILSRIVQNVNGVDYCRVIQPRSNIFFNFELTDLTEDELLEYSPDYIYFEDDDITVLVS